MENRKWLKRKYSLTFEEINIFLDDNMLNETRKYKYKIGRLTEDVIGYKKYSLILFKKYNPIKNPDNLPVLIIAKCGKKITQSGYHSFDYHTINCFNEITK